MLLDELADGLLLEELLLIGLDAEDDLGTTTKRLVLRGADGEGTTGGGLPDVLVVVVVLGDDGDLVGDEVGGVETDTELTDHRDIGGTGLESLHEGLGAGVGDGTEVVDEVGLGHTDTGIADGEGLVGLIGDDLDVEVLAGVELGGVGEGLVTDLVEGIGGVGNQLTKEDLLVLVEGVNDEGQ